MQLESSLKLYCADELKELLSRNQIAFFKGSITFLILITMWGINLYTDFNG